MKKTLMLLLCISFFQANAATFVSGIISTNTTWTKANSPYIVNGDLSVDSAVTLTIEPGVTVRVDSGYFFYIDGKIIAVGTATDSIIFIPDSISDSLWYYQWEGITLRIKGKNDTCRFKYCRFEYAGKAIYSEAPSFYVSNSVFRHNADAIRVYGFLPGTNCYFNINKCLITENGNGVYHRGRYSKGELTENELSNNSSGCHDESYKGLIALNNSFNYNYYGIYLSEYQQLPNIRWNTFKGNSYVGLYFGGSPIGMPGYSRTATMPISDNLFMYNNIGLKIDDIDLCAITNNTFAYNLIGIDRNYASSTPYYPTNLVINYNCLTNNTNYNFKENGKADFSVPNNWWGTASTAGIDSGIYDYYDNFSSGKITYTSVLTTSSGCQPVSAPPPCSQPASVNIVATSSTTAKATWQSSPGARAYEYYVDWSHSTTPNFGYTTTDTSVNLTGLNPGDSYIFYLRTKCIAAPFIGTWIRDTLTMPCDSPTNLIIDSITSSTAVISWDTAESSRGYLYSILPHPSIPTTAPKSTTNHSILVQWLMPGTTYDVCIRSICGSYGYSDWICDTFTTPFTTGIPKTTSDRVISIYPNPSNGAFNISLNKAYATAAITVYDMTGRVVATKQMNTANETISIGNAAKGIYTVRVVTDNAVVNKRIVIE